MEGAKLKGDYVDTVSKVTVAEYAREYLATRPHRASTAIRNRSLVEVHIAGAKLGALRLSAVRTSHVMGWIADRSRVLSPGTLRLLVQLMRSIFAAAVQDRMLASNPIPPRVKLPRSDKPDVVPLTAEQVEALALAIRPRCRSMVVAQAGLGLRIAELLALRKQNVDFIRGTVKIDAQLSQDGKTRLPYLKTPRSKRVLSLPDVVRIELARHIEQFGTADDGSLFTTERGNLYRQEHYQARLFRPAVRAAGLPEDITPHDLRHHFASVMLRATVILRWWLD
jgi:integrase